jgi:hypothetical protein
MTPDRPRIVSQPKVVVVGAGGIRAGSWVAPSAQEQRLETRSRRQPNQELLKKAGAGRTGETAE